MRRVLPATLAVVVAAAGAIGLVLFLSARDESRLEPLAGPGRVYRDLCAAHTARPFTPASQPPTSGPHSPVPVPRDRVALTDDELLHALELGNVVVTYPGRRPPAALVRLQDDLAGPFDPVLARAGQAMILTPSRRAGFTALAWRHAQDATAAADPRLRAFADFWLGRGYAEARGPNCPAPPA